MAMNDFLGSYINYEQLCTRQAVIIFVSLETGVSAGKMKSKQQNSNKTLEIFVSESKH